MKVRLFLLSLIILASLISISFYFIKQSQPKALLAPGTILASNNAKVLASKTLSISGNIWLPDLNNHDQIPINPSQISARTALVVDLTTSKILFSKNPHTRQPVASTLKIMTAILALEQKHPDDIFVISENAAQTPEDFMGISYGERYILKELLYGLLLPSGNDAAEAIAEGVAGKTRLFVEQMNNKAKVLGLSNTKFANPSGLDGDGEHYSTAYDMAVISRYAWVNFPLFRQIVGIKAYEIAYSTDHKYLYFENQTNLLSTYPGVKGIKPGYTPDAGLCLVTLAENGGHQILAVVLGSEDRRGDMVKLLDESFASLGINI